MKTLRFSLSTVQPFRVWVSMVLIGAIVPSLFAAMQGPPMKPWNSLPTDRERQHQVTLTDSPHRYEVVMDAAIDGVMTRMPASNGITFDGWQPNRFVRIENVGQTDVINPWLTVNGRRPCRTVLELAKRAVGSFKKDADKARAIWEFRRQHRFHACTWDGETYDAVKAFNVYGYTLCYNDAAILADAWKAAGLQTRRGYPDGHEVSEVFYDGDFHLLDGDAPAIYLKRDNETIASEADVVRDHDLIKRTHTGGILSQDDKGMDQSTASLYGYEGARQGENGGLTTFAVSLALTARNSLSYNLLSENGGR
jgi:hypothetical protein